jgi:hypothetical protein
MLRGSHVGCDTISESETEITRAGLDGLRIIRLRAPLFWELAIVEIVALAGDVREDGEVAKTG